MLKDPLHQLSIEAIIQGCRAESSLPRGQESGYCFELFRRALEDNEPTAWLAIDEQYRRLIFRWICDCASDLPQEEIEQIAPAALPKFWQSLTRSAEPLTRRFAHVGAVLSYLKQCTLSVLHDYKRQHQRRERIQERLESSRHHPALEMDTEQELLARIEQEQLLYLVRNWIKTQVTDPQERQILALSYESGLTPAEIAARDPDQFPDAQTVRRIKERVLKRARRALQPYATAPVKGETPQK